MNHATYLLNPGDMFQVDPDAVMYATGLPKPKKGPEAKEEKEPRKKRVRKSKADGTSARKQRAYEKWQAKLAKKKAGAEGGNEAATAPEADEGPLEPAQSTNASATTEPSEDLQKRLKALALEVRDVLKNEDEGMGVKRKRRLRDCLKRFKVIQAKIGRNKHRKDGEETVVDEDMVAVISQTLQEMSALDTDFVRKAEDSGVITMEEAAEAKKAAGSGDKPQQDSDKDTAISEEKLNELRRLMQEEEEQDAENPADPSKPYRTPWEPRNYMSAFAFIPRYLEVNPNICAAVYLRHPVARQGMAEIPSPFPTAVQELAFNWYLRRR